MSSIIGVSSLHQTAPSDKPPLKVAALASTVVPSSCFCLRGSVSRGPALIVSAIATPNRVLGEEVVKGLGGLSFRTFTKSPLVNRLKEEQEDGGELNEYDEEDEEEYGPAESEGGGNDELAAANPGLPQQLVDSLGKQGITSVLPIQVQPRAVRRPWYLSSGAGALISAAYSMQLVPSTALAQLCDSTFMQTAFTAEGSNTTCNHSQRLVLMDLDPTAAKLVISIIGPLLSAYGFLFIVRIVMSWYPKLPVRKFPYVVAYAPTEPLLILTRKLIPPLGGVDVTPVVWFGLISFLNEILVGPQGLLVLLSQQI